MELSQIIDIYNDRIDFISYWNKIIAPIYRITKFPCKCILHSEENGASFSYSYKQGIWSCFGKCKTGGRVVEFHFRFLQKDNDKITMMSCLMSLYKMFPEYNLPKPTLSTRKGEEAYDLANVTMLKNKLLNLCTVNKESDNSEIKTVSFTSLDDKILNIFIERRNFNEH